MLDMTPAGMGVAMAVAAERARAAILGQTPKADYKDGPRAGNFACPTCQVGENNAKVANYYTAWECWCCGDTENTTPRPLQYPDPAQGA